MHIPPFPRQLLPWVGGIATIIQIGYALVGGHFEVSLAAFTGGLALVNIIPGGGEKG